VLEDLADSRSTMPPTTMASLRWLEEEVPQEPRPFSCQDKRVVKLMPHLRGDFPHAPLAQQSQQPALATLLRAQHPWLANVIEPPGACFKRHGGQQKGGYDSIVAPAATLESQQSEPADTSPSTPQSSLAGRCHLTLYVAATAGQRTWPRVSCRSSSSLQRARSAPATPDGSAFALTTLSRWQGNAASTMPVGSQSLGGASDMSIGNEACLSSLTEGVAAHLSSVGLARRRARRSTPVRHPNSSAVPPPHHLEALASISRDDTAVAMASLSSRALMRSCPVCFCDLTPKTLETFGCGVHGCCTECLTRSASMDLRAGIMPRCFEPDCRTELDSLVALRLLEPEDHERYLHMALWSNPQVEACPQCRSLLYSDGVPPSGSTATCPSCSFHFCTDCRCMAHAGATCEAALKQQTEEPGVSAFAPSTSSRGATNATWISATCMQTGMKSVGTLSGKAGEWTTRDLERFALQNGMKVCPRCRAILEKADEDSCDHMTCAQCRHEFCWSCLADRRVIYAHGNHFHRPSCRFYSAYNGPNEYLPDRCVRCRLRGRACQVKLRGVAPSSAAAAVGAYYTVLVDSVVHWLREALPQTTLLLSQRHSL